MWILSSSRTSSCKIFIGSCQTLIFKTVSEQKKSWLGCNRLKVFEVWTETVKWHTWVCPHQLFEVCLDKCPSPTAKVWSYSLEDELGNHHLLIFTLLKTDICCYSDINWLLAVLLWQTSYTSETWLEFRKTLCVLKGCTKLVKKSYILIFPGILQITTVNC